MIINKKNNEFIIDLEQEIQKYYINGKKKAQIYRQKMRPKTQQQNCKKQQSKNPEQIYDNISNNSLHSLRRQNTQEKQIRNILSGRLKYIEVGFQRQKRMTQIARKKYEKVIEVRNASFHEKSYLQKSRKKLMNQYFQNKKKQVKKIHQQRQNTEMASQKCKENHRINAISVSKNTLQNEKIIQQRKVNDLRKRKTMVFREHAEQIKKRKKMRQRSIQKLQMGKTNYRNSLIREFNLVQMTKKNNTLFLRKFKERSSIMAKNKAIKKLELANYEKLLFLNSPNRTQTSFKNFYLTSS